MQNWTSLATSGLCLTHMITRRIVLRPAPQAPGVPIANENRLVLPDKLGTLVITAQPSWGMIAPGVPAPACYSQCGQVPTGLDERPAAVR
jgi:hypothetical protein